MSLCTLPVELPNDQEEESSETSLLNGSGQLHHQAPIHTHPFYSNLAAVEKRSESQSGLWNGEAPKEVQGSSMFLETTLLMLSFGTMFARTITTKNYKLCSRQVGLCGGTSGIESGSWIRDY